MKMKKTAGLLAGFLIFAYLVSGVLAFSGEENGYTVQGSFGWIAGKETASGNNVTFSGTGQPTTRATNSSIETCLGFVCPTKPFVRYINVSPASPKTTHILDCGFNVTDTDIEEILVGSVTWYLDGGSGFIQWANDDENVTAKIDIEANTSSVGDIESSDTTKNEQWKCSIMVADGFYSSNTSNSSAVTIGNTAPVVHLVRTFLNGQETSNFEPTDNIDIKVDVTDDDGRADIDDVLITITDPAPSTQVNNGSMAATTQITNGYTYQYDYIISGVALAGNWTIDVFANDTDNVAGSNSTTFIVFSPGITVQFILTINDTQSTVFIPGVGSVSAGSITPAEYVNPPDFFLSSELNNVLRGLVFQERDALSLIVNATGASHVLEMNQLASNSKTFLVFSRGGANIISNRMELVEAGNFLNNVKPTFGFGLGDKLAVKMLLNYNDINIGGNVSTLQIGQYKLVFESNKTDSGKALLINQLS